MSTNKRKALGRGLGALLPGAGAAIAAAPAPTPIATGPRTYFESDIENVYPNPGQPRRNFAAAELEELSRSIEEMGIIQPLIVRERNDGGYMLIAGERRWRAAQKAGLQRVPVVIQDVSEAEAFERAIVENIQREDLNAIEEAEAYARLIETYGYTQEQVATRVGKDRSTVANAVRLLKLPPKVRALVEEGQLSMGHARALLALDEPAAIETMARRVIARGLSVRATESLVRQGIDGRDKPGGGGARRPAAKAKSASVRDLESRLTKSLGARVAVDEDGAGSGGAIQIRYSDLDDLDRLLARLLK